MARHTDRSELRRVIPLFTVLLALLVTGGIALAGVPASGTVAAATGAGAAPLGQGKGEAQPQVRPSVSGPADTVKASPPQPAAPSVVLYDQLNNPGTQSTLSQQFGDFPAFTSQTADDFPVPGGQTWQITEVDAQGTYFNGTGNAASFNVYFYSSVVSGTYTVPAIAVYTATAQTYISTTGLFAVTLSSPANLLGGSTYYVSVQAVMNFGAGGEWGWTDRSVQSNGPAAWRNPGGGFGPACANWDKRTFCAGDAGNPDQMFRLAGTVISPGTATPTGTSTRVSTGTPTRAPTGTQTSAITASPTTCAPVTVIAENFESGTLGQFASSVATCVPGGCGWVITTTAHTGAYAAFAPDLGDISDQRLQSINSFTVPSAPSVTLNFWHRYALEGGFDGGVLELSTDGGLTWKDVLATTATFISGGYDGPISVNFQSPIAGRQAWTGNPHGTSFTQVQVNLTSLAGQTLKFRFREANDQSVGTLGWYIDDVSVIVTSSACATPTACPIQFPDVPPGSTFYSYVRCLACRGIVSGFGDGTFKPNNNVTRGQLSKIVSNSAGFNDPEPTQMFEDVPVGSTFQLFIGRLASRGYISGYSCGGPGEPCNPPGNRPYFRPNNNATRGQIAKIDADAAGYADPPSGQHFEDVPVGSTYYTYTYRLESRGIMSGYPCGGVGEPCNPPGNRPYFRPNNNATRGQTAKIVANTFYPGCSTPDSRR